MADGGVEVGRISIKVTPDTDGFRRKLVTEAKAAAEAAEKAASPVDIEVEAKGVEKAKAEIDSVAKDRKAEIKVDVDKSAGLFLTKLEDSLNRMKSSIGTFNRDFVNKSELFTGKQAPLLGIDFDGIQRKMDLLDLRWDKKVREFTERVNNPFGLSPDVGGTQRLMDRVSKLNFDNDVKAARESAKAQIEALKVATERSHANVQAKIDLDTADASAKAAAWRARESIKNLHVKLELDTGGAAAKLGLAKAASSAGNVVGGIFNGFNSIAEQAGRAAAGFRIFGVGAAAMLAVGTLIPPALALIAGGLLVLPGALAAIVTPLATVALGFGGIQKALQNAGFLADKLDKKGNPNGKKTAGEMIKELQAAVSDTFEAKLTPVFQNATKILDPLKASLPSVAGGLSDMADSFVQAVTSGAGMARIQSTIQNIGAALTNAAPGVGLFTDGLLNLAEKVSQRFPGVGTAFSKLGDQFNNWVTKFTTPDALGKSDLDRSLTSLHDTFTEINGLFSSDLIGKGFDFLKDPNFGKSMTDFVKSIRSLVQETLPQLGRGFQDISTTLKPITDILSQYDKVQKVLDFANPAKQTAKIFDPKTAAGDAQARLDAAIKAARENAAKAGGDAAESYTDQFLQGVNGGVPLKLPEPQQKFEASSIIEAFKGAGSLGASADIGVQLSENIKKATDQATATLQTGLAGLSAEFQAKLAEVGVASGAQIEAALAPLQQAPAAVMTAWQGVGAAITGSFATAIATVAQGASQIAAAVSAGFAQVPGAAAQAFSSLAGIAAGGMAGLVTAVVNGVSQAVAALQVFPQQIGALGAQIFASAQAAGAQVGAGLAAGISASTGQAVAAAQALVTAVNAAAKEGLEINSPSKVFRGFGYSINEGLGDGIEEQGNVPISKIKDVLQAIKDVFGSASGLNLNFNIGSSGTTGLVPQMGSLASSAKDFTSNLTEAVNPTQALTAEGKQQLADITEQLALLEIQRKELKVQKDQAGSKADKAAIQAQIDQITSQKDLLALEKDKLSYAKKYGEESWSAADALKQMGQSSLDAAFSFGKANADQLMSDLGIGGGAITGGANALFDWGTKAASNFIFNVSNVDDAISVKNNQVNKESLGIQGR